MAANFVRKLEYNTYKNKYDIWRAQYSTDYFFKVARSIRTFLDDYDYVIGVDEHKLAKRLLAFCWACTYAKDTDKEVSFGEAQHNGCNDDRDWYLETVTYDNWMKLFEAIEEPGLFDRSMAGQEMQLLFPEFIWRQLSLSESKSYRRFASIRECYEEDDWDSDGGGGGYVDEFDGGKWGSK